MKSTDKWEHGPQTGKKQKASYGSVYVIHPTSMEYQTTYFLLILKPTKLQMLVCVTIKLNQQTSKCNCRVAAVAVSFK